jgi:hypothetical protein
MPLFRLAPPPYWLRQVLVAALAALTYGSALNNDFVFDDVAAVRDNIQLRHIDLAGVVGIFTSDYWSGFHGDRSGLYRPLTVLSYALQYGGNHALPYHLLNLLLHAACTWGLYRFVKRLGQNESLALGSALLFAVHPALSEGVYAIVGRADLMAAALSLVALNLHLRNIAARGAGHRGPDPSPTLQGKRHCPTGPTAACEPIPISLIFAKML